MLVSAKEMLTKAKEGHYAVGQFNINNLEWTKAILLTAEENKSPVILGVSEGAGKYMCGYTTVVGMVNGMIDELGSCLSAVTQKKGDLDEKEISFSPGSGTGRPGRGTEPPAGSGYRPGHCPDCGAVDGNPRVPAAPRSSSTPSSAGAPAASSSCLPSWKLPCSA